MENKNSTDDAENLKSFLGESPPKKIDESDDNQSDKEKENLFNFNGPYSNFEEYMRHEEFIIKKLNNQSERKLREKNARLAFRFSSIWAFFIALIIVLKGSNVLILSETEFLFTSGSLTASVLAFYTLVLKFLFYRKDGT